MVPVGLLPTGGKESDGEQSRKNYQDLLQMTFALSGSALTRTPALWPDGLSPELVPVARQGQSLPSGMRTLRAPNQPSISTKEPPRPEIARSKVRRKWIADDDARILIESVDHLSVVDHDAHVGRGIVLPDFPSRLGVIEDEIAWLELIARNWRSQVELRMRIRTNLCPCHLQHHPVNET